MGAMVATAPRFTHPDVEPARRRGHGARVPLLDEGAAGPPDEAPLHAAAFAYLSDWWLNFCILRPHLASAGERGMYISASTTP